MTAAMWGMFGDLGIRWATKRSLLLAVFCRKLSDERGQVLMCCMSWHLVYNFMKIEPLKILCSLLTCGFLAPGAKTSSALGSRLVLGMAEPARMTPFWPLTSFEESEVHCAKKSWTPRPFLQLVPWDLTVSVVSALVQGAGRHSPPLQCLCISGVKWCLWSKFWTTVLLCGPTRCMWLAHCAAERGPELVPQLLGNLWTITLPSLPVDLGKLWWPLHV